LCSTVSRWRPSQQLWRRACFIDNQALSCSAKPSQIISSGGSMTTTYRLLAGLVLAAALYSAVPSKADTVSCQYRNAELHLSTKITTVGFLPRRSYSPSPFNCFLRNGYIWGNCSASWTFNIHLFPMGGHRLRRHAQLGIVRPGSACGAGNQSRLSH